ncbi:hypothetical protein Dimus_031719 [Dionaea muscipula]
MTHIQNQKYMAISKANPLYKIKTVVTDREEKRENRELKRNYKEKRERVGAESERKYLLEIGILLGSSIIDLSLSSTTEPLERAETSNLRRVRAPSEPFCRN